MGKKINLGRVSLVFKDDYDPNARYEEFDSVLFNGCSWVCLAPCKNVEPGTDETKWHILGAQGASGYQGHDGAQGAQGMDGAYAAQGIQGLEGPQGIQGETGIQGAQGITGTQGNEGNINTVYLTQAEYDELTDPDPDTLYIITDAPALQGVQGIQGETGIQGVQGVQGIQGETGIQGAQGNEGNVKTVYLTQAEYDELTDPDPDTLYIITDAPALQGIQGTQGPQGTTGIQGADGIQGHEGNVKTVYLTQAEYEALTDPDPDTLYVITDAPALQGVQGMQGAQGHSPANTETWTFQLANGNTLTRTIYMVPENQ